MNEHIDRETVLKSIEKAIIDTIELNPPSQADEYIPVADMRVAEITCEWKPYGADMRGGSNG